jgi:hypothetical protein
LVDSTDLIVIASIAQTVVITLTLGVFIFQFRSQEKAIKDAAYQNIQGRYTDYVSMLVDKPELSKLLSTGPMAAASPEDRALSAYILVGYGIFEEVYLLHKKKWIDEETWEQWSNFLKIFSTQPLFKPVHQRTRGTFDRGFEEYVAKIVDSKE